LQGAIRIGLLLLENQGASASKIRDNQIDLPIAIEVSCNN
jgi:hypothetical protein